MCGAHLLITPMLLTPLLITPPHVILPCCLSVLLQDYAWKDYVRGKDLQKFLASQQELLDRFTRQQGPGR